MDTRAIAKAVTDVYHNKEKHLLVWQGLEFACARCSTCGVASLGHAGVVIRSHGEVLSLDVWPPRCSS